MSWQGWRPADSDRGIDPAAIWLAMEGLAYFECFLRARAARREICCPGWDAEAKVWRFPLWSEPATADMIRSCIARPQDHRYVMFQRTARRSGTYYISEFGRGVIIG